MTKKKTAYEVIKETYSIETLREIIEFSCMGGAAEKHTSYEQTCAFYDQFEEEINEYLIDFMGEDHLEEMWHDNPCHLTGYKNDCVWSYISVVAGQIVGEYERQNSSKKD